MSPLEPVAQHIPAWKKLGLKLKYAKDEPVTEPNLLSGNKTDGTKKRKASDEEALEANSTIVPPKKPKKPKKIHNASNEASLSERIHKDGKSAVPETSLEPITSDSPSDTKSRRPELPKRKSVSFAPEAKTQDGDSAKDLYDQWLVNQKSDDATFDPATAAAALKVVAPRSKVASTATAASTPEDPSSQRAQKKPKKKSKSTTLNPNQNLTSPTTHSPPSVKDSERRPHAALSYLTTFHTSPQTWKFRKHHQTYLLKNLFSPDKIPCSYNPALKAYLTGLQGLSARRSIREQALEIRDKDEMFLSDILARGRRQGWEAERRREQYAAAWKREKDRLEVIEDLREWEEGREEFEWRLKKRRRAEDVLWAVGEVESKQPDSATKTESKGVAAASTANAPLSKKNVRVNTNTGKQQPEKKKRKRKRRTTGVPDDDVSSISSFSSDSDSDAELKKNLSEAKSLPKKPDEAIKKSNDSSPSSGLGNSSTESEEGDTSSSGSEESESDSDDEDGSDSDADGSSEDGSDSSDD